jgi:hypothetical protein
MKALKGMEAIRKRSAISGQFMVIRKAVLVALVSAVLAACETTSYDDDPYYDAGFGDGCDTAMSRAPGSPLQKPVRDQDLWKQSEGYRAGWKAGYSSCSPGGRGDMGADGRGIGGR